MPSARFVSSSGSRSTGVSLPYTRSDIKSSTHRNGNCAECRLSPGCGDAENWVSGLEQARYGGFDPAGRAPAECRARLVVKSRKRRVECTHGHRHI
jgi:hypothetical protein